MEINIIDCGLRDFLRDKNGKVIILDVENEEEAEKWLLEEGADYGLMDKGVMYITWTNY